MKIPKMTHPLSRYWDQPLRDVIEIDDGHALMDQITFNALLEYSTSIPSGVYAGKMWKCRIGKESWLLRWYEESEDPDKMKIENRTILVVGSQ